MEPDCRGTRHQLMTRLRLIAVNLFTGTALLLAQAPQTGGWRRFNDPPPAPAPQAPPAPAPALRPATRRCTALRSARGADRQARNVRDRARGTATLQRPQPAG